MKRGSCSSTSVSGTRASSSRSCWIIMGSCPRTFRRSFHSSGSGPWCPLRLSVARLRSERSVVQSSLVRYAEEAGWTYVTAEEALRLRRGETSPVLWYPFVDQVQKLHPGHVDNIEAEEDANRPMRAQPTIEGH